MNSFYMSMTETTCQLYPIALTNGVSSGRGYLFPWQIADGGVVKETCAKTVTIFAIPFIDGRGSEITHAILCNFYKLKIY